MLFPWVGGIPFLVNLGANNNIILNDKEPHRDRRPTRTVLHPSSDNTVFEPLLWHSL